MTARCIVTPYFTLLSKSIVSEAVSCNAVFRQKLVGIFVLDMITALPARNTSRPWNTAMSLIVCPMKDGRGLLRSSPTSLSSHAPGLKVNSSATASYVSTCGIVLGSIWYSTVGSGHSRHTPVPALKNSPSAVSVAVNFT